MTPRAESYERIYQIVRCIPRGQVATYGQVAELAGLPGHARQVGYALHALPDDLGGDETVPWQRVVNHRGEISLRSSFGDDLRQRRRLETEGVIFDERGRIDLAQHRWQPEIEVRLP